MADNEYMSDSDEEKDIWEEIESILDKYRDQIQASDEVLNRIRDDIFNVVTKRIKRSSGRRKARGGRGGRRARGRGRGRGRGAGAIYRKRNKPSSYEDYAPLHESPPKRSPPHRSPVRSRSGSRSIARSRSDPDLTRQSLTEPQFMSDPPPETQSLSRPPSRSRTRSRSRLSVRNAPEPIGLPQLAGRAKSYPQPAQSTDSSMSLKTTVLLCFLGGLGLLMVIKMLSW